MKKHYSVSIEPEYQYDIPTYADSIQEVSSTVIQDGKDAPYIETEVIIKAIFRVGERIKSPTFKKIIFELANNNILPKDIYNYRNSRHFIETVKQARKYDETNTPIIKR